MLSTPDVYNEIGKIVDKKFRHDLENDLLPDWSKFDGQHAEKVAKKEYMAVIERLVQKCPINTNYEKCQKELNEYTAQYIKENYPLMRPETMFNILNGYKNNELLNLVNTPLQAFVLYVELLRVFYFYIQEKYIRKSNNNLEIAVIHEFLTYSLDLLNGINALLLGGNNNSVISVYRTFYETYIVFAYLQQHPELTDAFLDHAKIDDCLLRMEVTKINKTELPDDVSKLYDDLIAKYGEHFDDNYGWTSAVIKERGNRTLKTMFEESNLGENFNYYYKLACRYSHASSFSLSVRPEFNQIISFLYGIADITYKEFDVLFSKLKINSTKERELLKQWLLVNRSNLIKELNTWYGNKNEAIQ